METTTFSYQCFLHLFIWNCITSYLHCFYAYMWIKIYIFKIQISLLMPHHLLNCLKKKTLELFCSLLWLWTNIYFTLNFEYFWRFEKFCCGDPMCRTKYLLTNKSWRNIEKKNVGHMNIGYACNIWCSVVQHIFLFPYILQLLPSRQLCMPWWWRILTIYIGSYLHSRHNQHLMWQSEKGAQ